MLAPLALAVSWISRKVEHGRKGTCHLMIFGPVTANQNSFFPTNPPEATDGSCSDKWPIRSFPHLKAVGISASWILSYIFQIAGLHLQIEIVNKPFSMRRSLQNGALAY